MHKRHQCKEEEKGSVSRVTSGDLNQSYTFVCRQNDNLHLKTSQVKVEGDSLFIILPVCSSVSSARSGNNEAETRKLVLQR